MGYPICAKSGCETTLSASDELINYEEGQVVGLAHKVCPKDDNNKRVGLLFQLDGGIEVAFIHGAFPGSVKRGDKSFSFKYTVGNPLPNIYAAIYVEKE